MNISFSKPIAVIADIHGNSDALAAVLADIDQQGVETILNLGDHFSGPLAALETAELIFKRDMICIRGNHDRILVEMAPEKMGASDKVAFEQLDEVHLSWLKKLPPTLTISDDIFLCHGTPESDATYWLDNVSQDGKISLSDYQDIEARVGEVTSSLILCGHTHIPRAIRLRDGRLIVNPGSVGAPGYDDDKPIYHVVQTGTPDASYALVQKNQDRWQVTFRLVPYDSDRMVKLASDASRSEWASVLASGWIAS